MNKLLTVLTILFTLGITSVASAAPYKLKASYRAKYCYDGGTYWAKQKAAYPEYYAANNAYYEAHYGANTMYCPAS